MVNVVRSFAILLVLAAAPYAAVAATTVTAVHATSTGAGSKSLDSASRQFADLLQSLPYDRFETIAEKQVALSATGETRVTINARYTLRFTDTRIQPNGHLKSTVRVYGIPRNSREPVEVLEMKVRLAPDKPVMIRGLRMPEGEIILFLNLS